MEVTRSKEEHQVSGVLLVNGIPMTLHHAGGHVQIAENEVISQRNVATSPVMVVQPRRPKKPKRPRKHRKLLKLLKKKRRGRRGSAGN